MQAWLRSSWHGWRAQFKWQLSPRPQYPGWLLTQCLFLCVHLATELSTPLGSPERKLCCSFLGNQRRKYIAHLRANNWKYPLRQLCSPQSTSVVPPPPLPRCPRGTPAAAPLLRVVVGCQLQPPSLACIPTPTCVRRGPWHSETKNSSVNRTHPVKAVQRPPLVSWCVFFQEFFPHTYPHSFLPPNCLSLNQDSSLPKESGKWHFLCFTILYPLSVSSNAYCPKTLNIYR